MREFTLWFGVTVSDNNRLEIKIDNKLPEQEQCDRKIGWALFNMLVVFVVPVVTPLVKQIHILGGLHNFALPIGILGLAFGVLTFLKKINRPLKVFLLATGISAVG